MLPHLAKFASMFGLKSSAGSYVKMQNECSLDAENPFCSQVGVSASDNRAYLRWRSFYPATFRSVGCICRSAITLRRFLSGCTENTV